MAQAFECLSEKHIVFLEAPPCFLWQQPPQMAG